ncbi:MAG: SRPBCC family protein [Cyclobacteriaceae bacterium]
MDINQQTPAYYCVETYIDVPPAKVYDVVSSLDEWKNWQTGVRMIRSCDNLQEGSSFKWNNSGMQITSAITETEPGKCICWKSRAMWIKATISWEFEPEKEGCRVVYEQSIEGFGSGFMKTVLSNSMETTLLELKKYCENEFVPA